jgi:hypothetical protein
MATTLLPPDHPIAEAGLDQLGGDDEHSYVRSVLTAWLVGIPVIAVLVATLVVVVGDVSFGGAVAVGLFAGLWVAPLAGSIGVGVWAAKHHMH